MSFFNDFIKDVEIEDVSKNIVCNLIFDKKIKICADVKIDDMQENEIILKNKKYNIKIMGKNLIIESISKGEFEISGKIEGVLKYD